MANKDLLGVDPKELARIQSEVIERLNQLREEFPDKPEVEELGELSSELIRQCYWAGELGDGVLFAMALKGKYIFNNNTCQWLCWDVHSWADDKMNQVYADVETVVEILWNEIDRIEADHKRAVSKNQTERAKKLDQMRSGFFKRIYYLRSWDGRQKAVKFARTIRNPIAIRGDELDRHPMLLGCPNCVVDLRTGQERPGNPEDFLYKTSPTDMYGLDVPCKKFERFLSEIFDEDKELIDYVQRLFGYAITGLTVEHILPVFSGKGRNGKSVLVEVISHVMGPLAGPIQAEVLLDQRRTRSSTGASPDIMGLRGLRLAFCSETDEGQRFSTAKVKWLTGGDTLVGRNPYDRFVTRFDPTHTLFLLTNAKPGVSPDDFAFWERVHLIPFHLSFVEREPVEKDERPAIKGLTELLTAEASGILAWLIKSCLMYQRRGLDPPEIVLKATAEYRRSEDNLADFIESECIVNEYAITKSSDLYDVFSDWYEKNISKKGISQKRFSTMLSKKFEKTKTKGIIHFRGVELRGEGSMFSGSDEKDTENGS